MSSDHMFRCVERIGFIHQAVHLFEAWHAERNEPIVSPRCSFCLASQDSTQLHIPMVSRWHPIILPPTKTCIVAGSLMAYQLTPPIVKLLHWQTGKFPNYCKWWIFLSCLMIRVQPSLNPSASHRMKSWYIKSTTRNGCISQWSPLTADAAVSSL